jgi:hypothetical protein
VFDHFASLLIYNLYAAYQLLWWWAPALAGLALLVGIDALKREKPIVAGFCGLLAMPGLAALGMYFALPAALSWLKGRELSLPILMLILMAGEFVAGLFGGIWFLRVGVQMIEKFKSRAALKTDLERDRKTDIRHIDKILPPEIGTFDPLKFINFKKGIFFGLDRHKKPRYVPADVYDESHMMIVGMTRSGKGIVLQYLGAQSLMRGELFVFLDPKLDKWLPHVLYAQAKAAGVPYVFLDLRQSAPAQINPFDGATAEEIENLLLAAFALSSTGEQADFYRVGDRRAALQVARMVVDMRKSLGRTPTAREIMSTEQAAGWQEEAKNFWGYMMELAELESVNAQAGISLDDLLKTGGCLYVLGDMGNERVVRMQRLILLRLMQLAKRRSDSIDELSERIIRVVADEFTVHISRPFMTSLAASAGWGLCVVLAFQTLTDLADCPSDLDKEAVKGKVWENTALKLTYRVRDADTAEWLAESTGEIQVDVETRRVDKNLALSETMDSDRILKQDKSNLIDKNMFLGMPKGCGVLFGASRLPEFCYTSRVAVNRLREAITPTCVDPQTASGKAAISLAAQMVALDDDEEGEA